MPRIEFHQNAAMGQATLRDDEGKVSGFVFCSVPGGTPWFTFDPATQMHVTCTDAPACNDHAEFRAFVRSRYR